MTEAQEIVLNAGLAFLAALAFFGIFALSMIDYVQRRLSADNSVTLDIDIEGSTDVLDTRVRLAALARLAPSWIEPSAERAAKFDGLFRSGGRPVGALSGREFLRACVMESVWMMLAAAVVLIGFAMVIDVSPGWAIFILVLAGLAGGPNQMIFVQGQARKHAANVTREAPYFLDLVVLVMQAGGNFRTAIETFLRSTPTGSMRREVLLMQQQLSQGDAAALQQLADRVTDPAVEQVIGTLAKGIETGGDPIKDAEQAERLRSIRSENAKALAKWLKTMMIFVVGVAFLGVILSIFAAVSPLLEDFG